MRKIVITQILEIVEDGNKENMWEAFWCGNKEIMKKAIDLFVKRGYEPIKLWSPYNRDISYDDVPLYDKKNIDKIVELMIRDKYFNKIVVQ